jgi:hypothetical protein
VERSKKILQKLFFISRGNQHKTNKNIAVNVKKNKFFGLELLIEIFWAAMPDKYGEAVKCLIMHLSSRPAIQL